jgi:hypothetical protein
MWAKLGNYASGAVVLHACRLPQPEVGMFYRILLFLWSFLLDVVVISHLNDEEKDLEILLLRQ